MSDAPSSADTRQLPDPRPLYGRAAEQLHQLVAAAAPEQLDRPTPCAQFDVRALLGHLVESSRRIAAVAEGGPARQPTQAPEQPADVPDQDWPKLYDEARTRMSTAWSSDALMDTVVTVPWGRLPGRIALASFVVETVTHAWDLARSLGREGELDEELAAFALAAARRALPAEGREGLPFGEAQPAPESAGTYARLAAWTGRDPQWDASTPGR